MLSVECGVLSAGDPGRPAHDRRRPLPALASRLRGPHQIPINKTKFQSTIESNKFHRKHQISSNATDFPSKATNYNRQPILIHKKAVGPTHSEINPRPQPSKLRILDPPSFKKQKGRIECHTWDMGGQDDYLPVHSLFMSQRCLYLLVCCSSTQHLRSQPQNPEPEA